MKKDAIYKAFFEINPLPAYIYDVNTLAFLDINMAAVEFYGYTRDEFLLMKITQMRPDEDVGELLNIMSVLRTGVRYSKVWRHRKKDGSVVFVELTSSGIDYKGISARIVIVNDRTEQLALSKQVQKSEQKYKTLVEHSPYGVLIHQDGKIVYSNDAGIKLLGYTSFDGLKDKFTLDTVAPEYREIVRKQIQTALEIKKPLKPMEQKYIRKDGKIIDVEAMGIFIDYDGKPAIQTIVHDISQRKKSEAALKESEEKYRMLATDALVGIYIIQDGIIKYANPKLAEILGYGLDELIEKSVMELIPSESRERIKEKLEKNMEGISESKHYEFSVIRKDSEHISVEAMGKSILYNGKPALQGMLLDITERRKSEEVKKKLEAHLYHSQKMEAVGTLAGGIAHDFNNILGGIVGYTSLAKMKMDESNPNYHIIEIIEKSAKRAAELTNQLLGFARLGKYEVKPINLNHIAKNVVQIITQTFDKSIQVENMFSKDLWTIEADPGQIEQVLMNICINARDAMKNGGRLTIETKNVTLDNLFIQIYKEVKEGDYVMLSVSDTGAGMEPSIKERIFEPFFSTKEPGKGTGMGLAMVYGIVRNHGGYIYAYSEVGAGTIFKVYLPAFPERISEDIEISKERKLKRGAETILVVDDEVVIREVLNAILEALGYNVLTAKDGEEACRYYEANKDSISLVILDIIMPTKGGKETYLQLKKIKPDVKVLVSSGYSIDGQAREIMDLGAQGFVQKPYDIATIAAKIREMLD